MKAEFLILQVCGFLDDLGDGYYKWHEPGRQLSRLPGVVFIDCHPDHHLLPSLMPIADIVVLPYYHDRDFQSVIEQRRAAGKATVFDASDYIYDVEGWSPFGAMCQDRSVQEEFRHYIRLADGVQTTTKELGKKWEKWVRRAAVFPHHLAEIPPLPPPRKGPLTIGLSGSRSHYADWYHLAPALGKWVEAHPDVHVAVMANEFAKPFFRLPRERYHFTPFSSLSAYLEFLMKVDIGLAPLLPTDFNRCRSDVKFLEYASRGVAGVYADLEPYNQSVVHGETGFLYKNNEELLHYLDVLASDASVRQRIREQAYEYVLKNRRISEHVGERLEFFRSLLPGATTGCQVPDEVMAAAVRHGNYLQLRPGEQEQALQAATKAPAARESAQMMVGVVEKYPNYLLALQRLGRMFNEVGDFRRALVYLERARGLDAKSALTLTEMGCARYGLRDVAGARRDLEAALEINPVYYPAWQYMLRLLRQYKGPDGAAWAQRAEKAYPQCYRLALDGARVYAGMEGVKELRRVLERLASTFIPEEMPKATAAFSEAIMQMAGRFIGTPEVLDLLRRACKVFPLSARLADMFGHALHLAGKEDESHSQYARALEIRRTSNTYRSEFPKDQDALPYWQFAEHIRKWAP